MSGDSGRVIVKILADKNWVQTFGYNREIRRKLRWFALASGVPWLAAIALAIFSSGVATTVATVLLLVGLLGFAVVIFICMSAGNKLWRSVKSKSRLESPVELSIK